MKLTVVGCSGSIPSADSAASCYLVEHDGFRIVLDLGHGALGALQKYVQISEIDAVAISHLHADHWIDLLALNVAVQYGPDNSGVRIAILGPAATPDRFADACGVPRNPGLHSFFDFDELALTTSLGPFRIRTAAMAHPTPTTAVRLDVGGQALVYSADTGPCAELAELAEGADLLLAEATFVDGEQNPRNLHMTGKQAGEVAQAAGVSHLAITHVPPWNCRDVALAEARTTFDGISTLASPGWSLELGQ